MTTELVSMSRKEIDRLDVIRRVLERRLPQVRRRSFLVLVCAGWTAVRDTAGSPGKTSSIRCAGIKDVPDTGRNGCVRITEAFNGGTSLGTSLVAIQPNVALGLHALSKTCQTGHSNGTKKPIYKRPKGSSPMIRTIVTVREQTMTPGFRLTRNQ